MIPRETYLHMFSLSSSCSGTCYRRSTCHPTSKTNTYDLHLQAHTRLNLHILVSAWEPPSRQFARIWKNWAPLWCNFFLWLAAQDKCWTTYRLARHGLEHPKQCLLCDQDGKLSQHILVSCVFAREVWYKVLVMVGLKQYTPSASEANFQKWWRAMEPLVQKEKKKASIY